MTEFLIFLVLVQSLCFYLAGNKPFMLKLNAFLLAVELSFIAGARHFSVGTDTEKYVDMMRGLAASQIDTSPLEWGYAALNTLLSYISDSYTLLFMVAAVIFYFGLIKFFSKNIKAVWLCVFIFLATLTNGLVLSAIRQSIACGVLLLAYDFITKRRPILFFILVYFASTFHNSAWIFLILYPLSYFKFDKNKLIFIALITLVIALFPTYVLRFFTFINPSYSYYNDNINLLDMGQYQTLTMGYLALIMIKCSLFLVPIFFGYFKKTTQQNNLLAWGAALSVIFVILSINIRIFSRIEFYFIPFLIMYYCDFIYNIASKKKRLFFAFSTLGCLMLFAAIVSLNNMDTISSYRFFWQ